MYMTRKRALAEGFTHEGTHYGIPIWFRFDGEGAEIAAKFAPLDFALELLGYLHQFFNMLLGEEYDFAFLVKPIE